MCGREAATATAAAVLRAASIHKKTEENVRYSNGIKKEIMDPGHLKRGWGANKKKNLSLNVLRYNTCPLMSLSVICPWGVLKVPDLAVLTANVTFKYGRF